VAGGSRVGDLDLVEPPTCHSRGEMSTGDFYFR
jgi:hypothetical protein